MIALPRLTSCTAMYANVDVVARAVVLQTVAVDKVAGWSAQSGCVGGHQWVMSGQTAEAHVQLLTVTACRYPEVSVCIAAQRVESFGCQSDARRRVAASAVTSINQSINHSPVTSSQRRMMRCTLLSLLLVSNRATQQLEFCCSNAASMNTA